MFEVAKVIKDAAIDPLLESGDPKVVGKITKVTYTGKTRWNYSFATKYCSWHRADRYPIFDSRVDFLSALLPSHVSIRQVHPERSVGL